MLERKISVNFLFPDRVTGLLVDVVTNIPVGVQYKKLWGIKNKTFIPRVTNPIKFVMLPDNLTADQLFITQKESIGDPSPHSIILQNSKTLQNLSVKWDPPDTIDRTLKNYNIAPNSENRSIPMIVTADGDHITDIVFTENGIPNTRSGNEGLSTIISTSHKNNVHPDDLAMVLILFLCMIMLVIGSCVGAGVMRRRMEIEKKLIKYI